MAGNTDRVQASGFWSGLNVAYGSGVAAILMIVGGLLLYNHGFVSAERMAPGRGFLALDEGLAFAPQPDRAEAIRVWNPFRDFELACETAVWSDGDQHLVAAWCPAALLDRPYRRDDVHDGLFGLLGLDVEEPDSHARASLTTLAGTGGYMPARAFFWHHTSLRCLDVASFDMRPQGNMSIGALGIVQVCLRGSEETVQERRDALLDNLAVRGPDGEVVRPWRSGSAP